MTLELELDETALIEGRIESGFTPAEASAWARSECMHSEMRGL